MHKFYFYLLERYILLSPGGNVYTLQVKIKFKLKLFNLGWFSISFVSFHQLFIKFKIDQG